MPHCTHCDGHVSQRFTTVFGDANSRVFACPNCSANDGIVDVSRSRAGLRWRA
ncbi:DUF7563 family protein [Halomarina oriensis]|uniref:DUF7563 family protein n=1 Tax=Halomarina oriensis TaxID=671145 RepID=UPI0018EF28AE|nr:hypothetical protein [Halomarina oriensis]